MKDSKTFKHGYCERFNLPEESFDASLFRKSVRWHVVPVVALIRLVYPKYFKSDFDFIRTVGACESLRDIRSEASSFQWECGNASILRRKLRIRISTTRTLRIAERILSNKSASSAGA